MRSPFHIYWIEETTAICLGRVTADVASGDATGENGEGYWLEAADVSTLTCSIYDLDGDTPTVATATPTVTIASAIVTPVTTNINWTVDTIGYNFYHKLAGSYFPEGNRRYSVVYKFTLVSDNDTFFGEYIGRSRNIRGI